jgi:hypothetical protein
MSLGVILALLAVSILTSLLVTGTPERAGTR